MQKERMKKILIVDDEQETTRVLQLGLRSRGYQAESVMSAASALHKLEDKGCYGMVLSDYSMPDMNGMQLLKEIRAAGNDIPFVLMTAYGEKRVLVEALHNHCQGFIEKPFTIDELIIELERVNVNVSNRKDSDVQPLFDVVPMLVHQLNNPLCLIKGYAQIGMVQSEDTDPIKEKLRLILDASKKIEGINKEILNLGKSMNTRFEILNMAEVLEDCVQSFIHSPSRNGAAIKYEKGEDVLQVLGNRFGLEQAFCNLIANGLEAMTGRSDGVLTVKLEKAPSEDVAKISVCDTGIGISADMKQNLFSLYYTTKKKGTGLGLAMVQQVITAHGGSIVVDSLSNEGTTFAVSLPVNQAMA